jgi:hypothetical protein
MFLCSQETVQENDPYTDILFSGSAGQLDFFLRENSISYQIYKPEEKRSSEEEKEVIELVSHRIDLTWISCKPATAIIKLGEPVVDDYFKLPGGLDEPAIGSSKTKILRKDLYEGIDVQWSNEDGGLKCEYQVAPATDYKQIALRIEGAKNIFVTHEGVLQIITPYGHILEGPPIARQDGKVLRAQYILVGDVLRFDIEDVDYWRQLTVTPSSGSWSVPLGRPRSVD